MRVIVLLPGFPPKTQDSQVRMDPTQSVHSQIIFKAFFVLVDSRNLTNMLFFHSVNLGGLLLQALLEFWPRTHINPMEEEEAEVNHGKASHLIKKKVTGGRLASLLKAALFLHFCSQRRTGEPASERQWLFPGASPHSGNLW